MPYLANAMKGWTQPTSVKMISKKVVNYRVTEAPTYITLDMGAQPMPATMVNRKPEEQRTWIWWTVYVKNGPLLKSDDVIIWNGKRFRIQQGISDWSTSGYQAYEAVQDFQGSSI